MGHLIVFEYYNRMTLVQTGIVVGVGVLSFGHMAGCNAPKQSKTSEHVVCEVWRIRLYPGRYSWTST